MIILTFCTKSASQLNDGIMQRLTNINSILCSGKRPPCSTNNVTNTQFIRLVYQSDTITHDKIIKNKIVRLHYKRSNMFGSQTLPPRQIKPKSNRFDFFQPSLQLSNGFWNNFIFLGAESMLVFERVYAISKAKAMGVII